MFVIDQAIADGIVGLMKNLEHITKTYNIRISLEIDRQHVRVYFEKGIHKGTYDISYETLYTTNFDFLDKSIYDMCQRMINN